MCVYSRIWCLASMYKLCVRVLKCSLHESMHIMCRPGIYCIYCIYCIYIIYIYIYIHFFRCSHPSFGWDWHVGRFLLVYSQPLLGRLTAPLQTLRLSRLQWDCVRIACVNFAANFVGRISLQEAPRPRRTAKFCCLYLGLMKVSIKLRIVVDRVLYCGKRLLTSLSYSLGIHIENWSSRP